MTKDLYQFQLSMEKNPDISTKARTCASAQLSYFPKMTRAEKA